ncbi:hypothetical protein GCM10010994_52470 [Chelatococcus reniformis]|uniref:Uncharacterized protein n=1 Tax=Chelatococcus reniformis TaxID=1494448 RepID=A0A916UUZ1_9HYPH|nr:hypothetical protein GCM10010994_52470 [Chelatococcus reniformis]
MAEKAIRFALIDAVMIRCSLPMIYMYADRAAEPSPSIARRATEPMPRPHIEGHCSGPAWLAKRLGPRGASVPAKIILRTPYKWLMVTDQSSTAPASAVAAPAWGFAPFVLQGQTPQGAKPIRNTQSSTR